MKRVHYYVSGDVQGVGFRHRAMRVAADLGITGWVRNLGDGRVELEVQGSEKALRQLLPTIETGSYIEITGIEKEPLEPIEDEPGFGVRY